MIASLLIAAFLGLFLYKIIRKDGIKLPGPTPWPFLGNLLQITRDRPHEAFDKWHKEFNRVFKIYQLGTPVVVVGSYEGMHEVLVIRGKDFAGRPSTHRFMLWGESNSWQDGIVVCPPDATWKMLRMAAQKHVKQFDIGMKRIEDVGAEICEDMLNNFGSHNGEAFQPEKYVMNAIMNNLTVFLIGKKFTTDDKLFQQFFEIDKLGKELFSAVGPHAMIDLFPWLRFFGNKTEGCFRVLIQKRNALFMQMKKELLDTNASDGETTLLESFLNLQGDPTFVGGELRVVCAACNMIIGGVSTSTSSFLAFVNIITHYRDVYVKLQGEVEDILGTRPPRFEDRDNMPYTKAAIFELLRYTSIAPFSIPHMAVRDTTLGDAFIPKGTQVLINQWSALHDESYWPEPFEFRPERFLDEFGNLLPVDHDVRKRLMVFGAGPRVCIGEVFALGRLFLLITSMIQRFEIEQPEPKVSCDPRGYRLGVAFFPPDVKVVMTSRSIDK